MVSILKFQGGYQPALKTPKQQPRIMKTEAAPVQFGSEKTGTRFWLPAAALLSALGITGCDVLSPQGAPTAAPVVQTQPAPDSGVIVSGTGTIKKDPDGFSFTTYVKEESTEYDTVLQNLGTRGEALSSSLKALNLSLECSSAVAVQPKYNYNNGTSKLEGYEGTYTLKLKGNIANEAQFKKDASEITKILAQNSALFSGPYFSLSNTEAAQKEALEKAIQTTVEKAKTVAKTMGFEVNEKTPFSVSIGDNSSSGFYGAPERYSLRAASASAGGGGIGEEAFNYKQLDIQSPQVNIRFNINPAQPKAAEPTPTTTPQK